MDTILFTPAAVLELLAKIDELSDLTISIDQTLDGSIQVTVGESTYIIDDSNATEVSVEEDVVDSIEDANMDAYEELKDDGYADVENFQDVESGILKEVAKSLLLGGMIRLSAKLLK